jgi:hypothetical protein
MVTDTTEDNGKTPQKQGSEDSASEPNKINASTPYDFHGKNLTPYGGLLPVITMLEKLDFPSLVKETLASKRIPRAMDLYRFVLGIVLGLYIGFPRLNQLGVAILERRTTIHKISTLGSFDLFAMVLKPGISE